MWIVAVNILDEQRWVTNDRFSTVILRDFTYSSGLCEFFNRLCGSYCEHSNGYLGSIKKGKFIGKLSCSQLPMNVFTR
jgi:hypothetical protein